MKEKLEQRLGRMAGGIVEASRTHPRSTLLVCALVTILAGVAAVTQLSVDTDPDFLTSPDLEFRKTNAALRTAFPQLQNNFVVLVEAESGNDARAAAEELAGLLRGDSEHYSYIYLPGADPFFRDNGFFYLDPAEIEPMAERFERVGPLLAALAEQPRLATLLAAVSAAGASEGGLDSLGSDGGRILTSVAAAVESFNQDELAAVAWDDLLSPAPSVGHRNLQVLFVQPTTDLSDIDAALESLAKVRAAAAAVEARSGLRIQVTGDRAVHTEEMSLLLDEILVAGLLSLALVILILFSALKSFRLLIATVLTLLAGLVWTAGFAGVSVGRLNMLTTTFPVLYIGLGVDFGIHFAMGYREGRRRS